MPLRDAVLLFRHARQRARCRAAASLVIFAVNTRLFSPPLTPRARRLPSREEAATFLLPPLVLVYMRARCDDATVGYDGFSFIRRDDDAAPLYARRAAMPLLMPPGCPFSLYYYADFRAPSAASILRAAT